MKASALVISIVADHNDVALLEKILKAHRDKNDWELGVMTDPVENARRIIENVQIDALLRQLEKLVGRGIYIPLPTCYNRIINSKEYATMNGSARTVELTPDEVYTLRDALREYSRNVRKEHDDAVLAGDLPGTVEYCRSELDIARVIREKLGR
jgi:hypothetical protein